MLDKYFLVLCCFLISLADSNFRHYGSSVNCSPIKSTIQQLSMKTLCYKTLVMDDAIAAYAIHPNERPTETLAPCMKCPVTIVTTEHHFRFSVLVYSLQTETSRSTSNCTKFRLDVFNGRRNVLNNLLSGAGGLCGKSPPGKTYITSGNSVTIQLSTECSKKRPPKQTANFNIVVSKLNNNDTQSCPGQFQCDDGLACFDKERVCNDVIDCQDQSDERNCPTGNTAFAPWMIALAVMAAICTLAFLIFFSVWIVKYCLKTFKGYSKM